MQGFCVGRGRGNSCVSTRDYLIVMPQEGDQGTIGGFMMRRLLARGRGSALAFPITEIGIRDKKKIPNTVSVLGILFH
jgi:hypothetical protein